MRTKNKNGKILNINFFWIIPIIFILSSNIIEFDNQYMNFSSQNENLDVFRENIPIAQDPLTSENFYTRFNKTWSNDASSMKTTLFLDLDDDGDLEMLRRIGNYQTEIYTLNQSGYQNVTTIPIDVLEYADYDGDGVKEFIGRPETNYDYYFYNFTLDGGILNHEETWITGYDDRGAITCGDLEGDGKAEFIYYDNGIQYGGNEGRYRLISYDSGSFSELQSFDDASTQGWDGFASGTLIDIDGDGLDEIACSWGYGSNFDGGIRIFDDYLHSYSLMQQYQFERDPLFLSPFDDHEDLNNDGVDDLVVGVAHTFVDHYRYFIWYNSTTSSFSYQKLTKQPNTRFFGVGYLDEGDDCARYASFYCPDPATNQYWTDRIRVYQWDTFELGNPFEIMLNDVYSDAIYIRLNLRDINGDGFDEIIFDGCNADNKQVTFFFFNNQTLAPDDPLLPPIIPLNDSYELSYSTYFGGNGDDVITAIVSHNGYTFIAGHTSSTDFPGYSGTYPSGYNLFISKFLGQELINSTIIGGDDVDYMSDMVIENNEINLVGHTKSNNFPTLNSIDPDFNGGYDIIIMKLSTLDFSLHFSTYYGGSSDDTAVKILYENNSIYVLANTYSSDITMLNSYDVSYNGGGAWGGDIFIMEINDTSCSLIQNTYLGGTSMECVRDAFIENGNIYLCGHGSSSTPVLNGFQMTHGGGTFDGLIMQFDTITRDLVFSTFLGGGDNLGGNDYALGIVKYEDYLFVTGHTENDDFPILNAYQPDRKDEYTTFLSKISLDGGTLLFSTYVGGSNDEWANGIEVANHQLYIWGITESSNFPVKYPINATNNGDYDIYLSAFTPDGNLSMSTYLGGSAYESITDLSINQETLFMVGYTDSDNFPILHPLQFNQNGRDGVLIEINFTLTNLEVTDLEAKFFINSTQIFEKESIQFTDNTTGGTLPYSFQWNFGDGSANSTEQNPIHQYNSGGTYSAILTVTDNDGDISVSQSLNISVISIVSTNGIWLDISTGINVINCIDDSGFLWMNVYLDVQGDGLIKLTHSSSNPSSISTPSEAECSHFYSIEINDDSVISENPTINFFFPDNEYSESQKEQLSIYKLESVNWTELSSTLYSSENKIYVSKGEVNSIYSLGYSISDNTPTDTDDGPFVIPGYPIWILGSISLSICILKILKNDYQKKKRDMEINRIK